MSPKPIFTRKRNRERRARIFSVSAFVLSIASVAYFAGHSAASTTAALDFAVGEDEAKGTPVILSPSASVCGPLKSAGSASEMRLSEVVRHPAP